jgi:hypothetical protein
MMPKKCNGVHLLAGNGDDTRLDKKAFILNVVDVLLSPIITIKAD